jgi:hypothetical protein
MNAPNALAATSRERRMILYGGVAVAIIVLLRVMPSMVSWHRREKLQARNARSALANARAAIASHEAVAARIVEKRGALVIASSQLVRGHTPAESEGIMGALVSDAAEGRVTLLTAEPRVDSAAVGRLARLHLLVTAEGNALGLAHFLWNLERGPTLVVVRELTIGRSAPLVQGGGDEILRIELLVEALSTTLPRQVDAGAFSAGERTFNVPSEREVPEA